MSGMQPTGGAYLCSALVRMLPREAGRGKRGLRAVLERIAPGTASLLTERPVGERSKFDLLCGDCVLRGTVRECRFDPHLGYSVTLEFDAGSRWSPERFRPEHLTAPSEVRGCSCKNAASCPIRAAHKPAAGTRIEERVLTAGSETAIVSPGMTLAQLGRCFTCFFGLSRKSPLCGRFVESYRQTERAIGAGGEHENAALVLARLARVLGGECIAPECVP